MTQTCWVIQARRLLREGSWLHAAPQQRQQNVQRRPSLGLLPASSPPAAQLDGVVSERRPLLLGRRQCDLLGRWKRLSWKHGSKPCQRVIGIRLSDRTPKAFPRGGHVWRR